jgi:pyruvate formate lyase activating enzyme
LSTAVDGLTRIHNVEDNVEGVVFNIQRYSIQDGPGIRTTVFLKGCPLRCSWCSNPESQNTVPEIVHRDSLCTKCGRCLDVCNVKAISVDDKSVSIDRKLCRKCFKCVQVCAVGAIKSFGDTMSAKEVFQLIRKDAEFYRDSGGGVTVSGGEPLSQPDFVAALFKLCRDGGIDTCLETSGYTRANAFEKVLPYTSLVLYDVKLSNPVAHRKWTKKSNKEILRNLAIAAASATPVIIRIPLIPGVNDSDEELKNIAINAVDFLKKPGKVNILPYHRFGMGKYQMLDRKYQLTELITPKDPEIQRAKCLFESFGLECEVVL